MEKKTISKAKTMKREKGENPAVHTKNRQSESREMRG